MGESKNPAKKAAANKATAPKVSSAAQFKKRKQGQTLPLPSGLVVKAKRVELQTMVLQGSVPNPLMETVSAALEKGQKADIAKMVGVDEGKIDLDTVRDMYEMVNAVVMESVLEPKVHPQPVQADVDEWNAKHPDEQVDTPEDLRDDDLLYIDEFDDTDKMFMFQWASGGTSDLEQFRRESESDMASLAEIQGAQAAAK